MLMSEGQLCSQSPVSVGTFWLGKDLTPAGIMTLKMLPLQRNSPNPAQVSIEAPALSLVMEQKVNPGPLRPEVDE